MPQCSLSTAGPSSSVALECECLAHRFGSAADSGAGDRATDGHDGWGVGGDPAAAAGAGPAARSGWSAEAYCHRAMLDQCHVVKGELAVSRVK